MASPEIPLATLSTEPCPDLVPLAPFVVPEFHRKQLNFYRTWRKFKDFQTDQGILQMRKKTRHFQAKTPQLTDKLQRMISDERQTVQAQVNQPQWLS